MIGFDLSLSLQTVDRPKDWYKTMFKQIHMVHKAGEAGGLETRTIIWVCTSVTQSYSVSLVMHRVCVCVCRGVCVSVCVCVCVCRGVTVFVPVLVKSEQ